MRLVTLQSKDIGYQGTAAQGAAGKWRAHQHRWHGRFTTAACGLHHFGRRDQLPKKVSNMTIKSRTPPCHEQHGRLIHGRLEGT